MAGGRRWLCRVGSSCRRLPPVEQAGRVSEEKRDAAGVAQWEAGLATAEASRAEYSEATRRAAWSDVELLRRRQQDAGGEDAGGEAAVVTACLTGQGQKAEKADYYDQQIKELEETFQEKSQRIWPNSV